MHEYYFDYNATSFASRETLVQMVNWCNRGNPSSGYRAAKEIALELLKTRERYANHLGYICKESGETGDKTMDVARGDAVRGDTTRNDTTRNDTTRNDTSRVDTRNATDVTIFSTLPDNVYRTIFTSGATESNATICMMVAVSYTANVGKPHFVIAATEHRSLIDTANSLNVEVTLVAPDRLGFTTPASILAAIRPNTALISVQHANNETGCINDIAAIGAVAHKHNIPFHTDAVQTIGRIAFDPYTCHVDAFSASAHKYGGVPGTGLLVIRENFLTGWRLRAVIPGSRQANMRGGTENYPGIIAGGLAFREHISNRKAKNADLLRLKRKTIEKLSAAVQCKTYREYLECSVAAKRSTDIVFISTLEPTYLPNTLLMSIVRRRKTAEICNVDIKIKLEKAGFVVSIGSACNTSNAKASHVVTAMGVDDAIRKGVLRVSFGDENTEKEVDRFVEEITAIVGS